MNKVKVDLNQAIEFENSGFDVEHYVVMRQSQAATITKKRISRKFVPDNTVFRISVVNEGPTQGNGGVLWEKAKKHLFNNDPSKTMTYRQIKKWAKQVDRKHGNTWPSLWVNRYKCLVKEEQS